MGKEGEALLFLYMQYIDGYRLLIGCEREDLRWEQWGEKKRDKAKSKLFKLLIELKAKHTHK